MRWERRLAIADVVLQDVEATAGIPMEPVVREARTSIGEDGVGNLSTTPDHEHTDPLPQQLSFAMFIEEYINNPPPRDTTALYNIGYPFQGNPTIHLMQLYRQYARPPD
jgi:hypothetical protein